MLPLSVKGKSTKVLIMPLYEGSLWISGMSISVNQSYKGIRFYATNENTQQITSGSKIDIKIRGVDSQGTRVDISELKNDFTLSFHSHSDCSVFYDALPIGGLTEMSSGFDSVIASFVLPGACTIGVEILFDGTTPVECEGCLMRAKSIFIMDSNVTTY
jgi:hypothetical protein